MSDWKLLNTSTASGASSVEFTDLTGYKIFKFVFIEINAANDGVNFQLEASTGSYGVTKTTTFFQAYHFENDSSATVAYATAEDQAQSTNPNRLVTYLGNLSDENTSGELTVFNPASTTYVKHFYSRGAVNTSTDVAKDVYTAGYFNTTSALNGIRFTMSSGNFDGTIKQYGLVAS